MALDPLSPASAGYNYPLVPPTGKDGPPQPESEDPRAQDRRIQQAVDEVKASDQAGAPQAATARPVEEIEEPQAAPDGEDQDRQQNQTGPGGKELTAEEQAQVRQLEARDREVRAHERAHIAAGGQYVSGGASYTYETGPDGKRYATGGEVAIDASKADTPEQTIQKARTIRKAALAPARPSATDRQVAAKAAGMEQEARAELREEKQEEARLAAEAEASGEGVPASGNISRAPGRLPQAPPYSVRVNPLSRTV